MMTKPQGGTKQDHKKIKHFGTSSQYYLRNTEKVILFNYCWVNEEYFNDNRFQEFALGKRGKLGTKFAIVATLICLFNIQYSLFRVYYSHYGYHTSRRAEF